MVMVRTVKSRPKTNQSCRTLDLDWRIACHIINICYSPAGRSVQGGLGPYSRLREEFFPIRTPRPVNNVFIFFSAILEAERGELV